MSFPRRRESRFESLASHLPYVILRSARDDKQEIPHDSAKIGKLAEIGTLFDLPIPALFSQFSAA